MYDFAYHRPETAEDAAALYAGADDPLYLAGGQTLVPVMKQRLAMPSDVIDLRAIAALQGIAADGDGLRIGAMTPHAAVAASDEVRARLPALTDLASGIGDPHVRNRGTIGGSIANNDPAADYPAALVALGATVYTASRAIAAEAFFTDMFETALEEGELVTHVTFPAIERAAYVKFANPASRYAVAGVFVAAGGQGIRVAVTGAAPCVFRVEAMEEALASDFSPAALDGISVDASTLNSDPQASADYRAHLIGALAKRAVAKAG